MIRKVGVVERGLEEFSIKRIVHLECKCMEGGLATKKKRSSHFLGKKTNPAKDNPGSSPGISWIIWTSALLSYVVCIVLHM